MKERVQLSEDEGSTEFSEAASQGRITSAEWAEIEAKVAGTEEEGPWTKSLRPLEWGYLAVLADDPAKDAEEQRGDIEVKTLSQVHRPLGQPVVYTPSGKVCLEIPAEQQLAPSTQMSSGKVDLDNGKDPLAEESKSVVLSAADMLDEQVISLLTYLNKKMKKYAEPSIAGSYVELVRSRTRVASTKVAERVNSLATEKNLRASLEKESESLWIDISNAQKWEIQTLKWMKLRELERRVTTLIASSVGGHRHLDRKLDSFISGLE
ncbi:hypothetical protein AXG93_4846s1060 [Marchantia polymorpha subsp. ruderalis]|uniref:Uncharacterized protein n=1 Tax=Marchantia polymorpha subsp. ruderalis TaxID=1480154 RepID=A0A176VFZ8_MARPO|nr:hypothetical protein AXG93_4846s1060 [Marchantia polymorpha subsp. ruderalis]